MMCLYLLTLYTFAIHFFIEANKFVEGGASPSLERKYQGSFGFRQKTNIGKADRSIFENMKCFNVTNIETKLVKSDLVQCIQRLPLDPVLLD